MKKITNNMKRRNNYILLAVMTFIVSLMLVGCSSNATTETVKSEPETVVKEEVVQAEVEETTQEEVVEEIVEKVEQNIQEAKTFESAGEWAQSIERAEPQMTIWNEITKEGIILENEQKYSLKEGDLLVICTKEKNSGVEINSDMSLSEFKSRSSSSYTQFIFNKEFLEETLFEFVITVAGVEYPFSVILISENDTATPSESSETTEMSGKDWVKTLEYEEPKLVAWNDETGSREVIETGEKYAMQQGDVLGVYHPDEYYVFTVSPVDFSGGLTDLQKVTVMDYQLPSESQNINLEVEVMDRNDKFIIFNYVVTTP